MSNILIQLKTKHQRELYTSKKITQIYNICYVWFGAWAIWLQFDFIEKQTNMVEIKVKRLESKNDKIMLLWDVRLIIQRKIIDL